jgi:potassium-dependent mechanosensitive channel
MKAISDFRNCFRLSICSKAVFLILLGIISVNGYSQTFATDSTALKTDSINVSSHQTIEQIAAAAAEKSQTNYNKARQIQKQNRVFNQLRNEIQNAENILKQGIDYAEYTTELDAIMKYKEVAINGILTYNNEELTIRNLTTTSILLTELVNRTENQLKNIRENNQLITDVQHTIDSLMADESVYVVPRDSASGEIYLQRYQALYNDFIKANSRLKNALDSIQHLEVLSNAFKYNLEKDYTEINLLQKKNYQKILSNNEKF